MDKDFDVWNKRKKMLHRSDFRDYVHEREVWWCALGVNIGVEADGKHSNFERPILIIKKFSRGAALIVPITSRLKEDNPYYVAYVHQGERFAAVISQVRLISTKRLLRKMFTMDTKQFVTIRDAVVTTIQRKRPPLSRGPRRPHGH